MKSVPKHSLHNLGIKDSQMAYGFPALGKWQPSIPLNSKGHLSNISSHVEIANKIQLYYWEHSCKP